MAPSEQGQVSDCVDHNIQTIAAGPSQCLIMDILNDVMGFGLECIASKGLYRLKLSSGGQECVVSPSEQGQGCCWIIPMSHYGYIE